MATSPHEATKAVSKQIMKMYCWLANLLVIVNVFANQSPRTKVSPARYRLGDVQFLHFLHITGTGRVELKQWWYIKYSNNAPKHSLDTHTHTSAQ